MDFLWKKLQFVGAVLRQGTAKGEEGGEGGGICLFLYTQFAFFINFYSYS